MRAPAPTRAAALAVAAAAATAVAACDRAEPMTLVPPLGGMCDLDYACATHVEVTAFGNDPMDAPSTCVAIPPGTVRSLADNGLDGLVDLPLPKSGLKYVQVRIVAAKDGGDCATADTLAYGVGGDDGSGQVAIPLMCSLDCAQRQPATHPVQVFDLTALIDHGQCAPPAGAGPFDANLGIIRPTGATDGALPPAMFEPFAAPAAARLAADGTATPSGAMFAKVAGKACYAAGVVDESGQVPSASCLDVVGGRACAPAGTLELAYLSADTANAALDPDHFAPWQGMSLVAVWDPVAHAPIVGATVSLITPGTGDVTYVDRAAGRFTTRAATATGSGGLAVVYARGPVAVTVAAPGHASRALWLGADSDFPAGQVVVLQPQ